MSWLTPQQFASLLDAESVGREPAPTYTAPFHGIPRALSEDEYLDARERAILAMRRQGMTLLAIGDEHALSPERVRCILLKINRKAFRADVECRRHHCFNCATLGGVVHMCSRGRHV